MNALQIKSQNDWVKPMLAAMAACYRQFQSGSDRMVAGKDYVAIRHELERLGFAFAFKRGGYLQAQRIAVTENNLSEEIAILAAKYLY